MNYFKSIRFRKGGLSLLFIAIVLVLVILLNVFFSFLGSRVDLSADFTAGGDYTMSLEGDYLNFVEKIDKSISITVCAKETDFDDGNFASNMLTTLSLSDSIDPGYASDNTVKYARQTGIFVNGFTKLNSNISVDYKNPNSETEFKAVTEKYSGENLAYGDIIVSCIHNAGKKNENNRYSIVNMSDYFSVTEDSNYSEYAQYYGTTYNKLVGSDLASAITSAFYTVTSENTEKITVFTGYNTNNDYTNLDSLLKKNNYELNPVESIDQGIPKDCNTILIYAPQIDFKSNEIDLLDKYLKNDGKYGRHLLYVSEPMGKTTSLPNLEEYLTEWGISFEGGFVCEPDQGNYYYYPYYIQGKSGDSDYTKLIDESLTYPYASYSAIKPEFTEKGMYTTETIVKSSDNAVIYPYDASTDWKIETAKSDGALSLVMKSTLVDSTAKLESNVVVFGGTEFFGSDVLEDQVYGGKKYLNAEYFANSPLILKIVNDLTGVEETDTVEITTKSIDDSNFKEQITDSAVPNVLMIIFVVAIPVILLALGITVWIVRKKR